MFYLGISQNTFLQDTVQVWHPNGVCRSSTRGLWCWAKVHTPHTLATHLLWLASCLRKTRPFDNIKAMVGASGIDYSDIIKFRSDGLNNQDEKPPKSRCDRRRASFSPASQPQRRAHLYVILHPQVLQNWYP